MVLRRKDGVFIRKPASVGQARTGFALCVETSGRPVTDWEEFQSWGCDFSSLSSCTQSSLELPTQPEALAQLWWQAALQAGCGAHFGYRDRQRRQGEAVCFPPCTLLWSWNRCESVFVYSWVCRVGLWLSSWAVECGLSLVLLFTFLCTVLPLHSLAVVWTVATKEHHLSFKKTETHHLPHLSFILSSEVQVFSY